MNETFLSIPFSTWWFIVVGGVFTGYAILDGFDLGAGALHLFFKKEESRRIALNAIGPVWDGNEVWLVIGGGALFAGFPVAYATLLSSFYELFMLFLALLILRAISIEFRSKEPSLLWRKSWDIVYSFSSWLLAIALGLVLGNVMQGIAIDSNYRFHGTLIDFLNPYAFLVSLTTLALFQMHGSIYLVMKTESRLHTKLTRIVRNTTIFFVLMYSLTTVATLLYMPHLLTRYREIPWTFVLPLLTILSVAGITRQINQQRYRSAFFFSALVIAFSLMMAALGLFPVLIRSTLDPAYSISVSQAASTDKSLGIMLTFALIGIPLVATYTTFVYYTFRGKVRLDDQSY